MNYAQSIIDKCGGASSLARTIKKPVNTVQSWGYSGAIPDKHKLAVLQGAAILGVKLTPEDFFPKMGDERNDQI